MIKKLIKRKVLLFGMMGIMFSANAQNSAYVSSHKLIANLLSEQYGIPASVILAIAIVESGAGNGATARVLNNHFGIVGHNEVLEGTGHKSRYKEYSNTIASYMDFCKMLTRKKFYSKLKDNEDPIAWINAISHTGYSEDPKLWEKRILGAIKANSL